MFVLDLDEGAVTTSVGPVPVTRALPPGMGGTPEQAHANRPRLLQAPQRTDRLVQVLRALSGNMDAEEPVAGGNPRLAQHGVQEALARSGLSFGC